MSEVNLTYAEKRAQRQNMTRQKIWVSKKEGLGYLKKERHKEPTVGFHHQLRSKLFN